VQVLGQDSLCLSRFIVAKHFVESLMKQQLPEGLQIVATDKSYFTDHGIGHVERVIGKLEELSRLLRDPIKEKEAFLIK
jgi:hypothetical protein